MRRVLAIAAILGVASGTLGREVAAEEEPLERRAGVAVSTDRTIRYVGEVTPVSLRVTYDPTFFREHAVWTWLRPMDVPVLVDVPWWETLPGAQFADAVPGAQDVADGRVRFALNDVVMRSTGVETTLRRSPSGTESSVFEVRRTFVATRPGDLVLAAPTLRFTFASSFRDDLVGGRVPLDTKDVEVRGEPLTIHVVALPDAGRPPDFVDAVGTFTIASDADRREVEVGKPFRLTLRIEGALSTSAITRPRLDGLAGFHVYGAIDDHGPRTRTIVFDVAALDPAVREFPPIPLAFFDPEPPAGYRVVRTDAIPLTVRTASGTAAPAGVAARTPERTPGLVQERWFLWLSGTLVVVVIAVLTLRAKRRVRKAEAIAPLAARALAAGDVFRTRVSRPNGDASEAFAEFLAARLGSTAAAVITPDLRARLGAAGAPDDLADHAAATLERLATARYARAGTMAREAEGLGDLVEALERALRPPGE